MAPGREKSVPAMWKYFSAWSFTARTTSGWQCPVLVTAMPEEKSR
jgi:hypothetical protein